MILEKNQSKETDAAFKDDRPPPYSINVISEPGSSSEGRHTGDTATGTPTPVNHAHIRSHYRDLSGTFYVDPELPSPGPDLCVKKNARRRCGKSTAIPNASFRTRHGAVSLNLAVTGASANTATANIVVVTRTGDINLNLLSGHSMKRISLDVRSRKGNIVLLVPKSFHGAIHLRTTRRGSLNFLPAFASVMKFLKSDDNEALVLVGDTTLGNFAEPDYCELTSRLGKVTVGVSGEDHYVAEVGVWKKLGEYIKGIKNS